MSTIDLERLIVRQTYFIPVTSSELRDAILEQLTSSDSPIAGICPWGLMTEHKLSFHFELRMKYIFLHSTTWGIDNPTKFIEVAKEKAKEFDELGPKAFYSELKHIIPSTPMDIYVRVKKIEKDGCWCKVECLPALYKQLRYIEDIEPNDFQMQDAYLTCKRFLETIFEGGLLSTLFAEEKKDLLKPTMRLLINDQTSHPMLDKIVEMLDEATADVWFCGWVGTILLPKLKEIKEKGVDIHIITHQSSELKGKPGKQDVERAFDELIPMIGKDHISRRPECHCRVLLVDNKALIGSMDLNSISLAGTHREVAVYTEDPEMVRTLRKYFKEVFSPLKETE